MRFDGLFSLGFPRDDGGDEIDARIRVVRRDVDSPAPRLRDRRLPRVRIAVGRVPSDRRLPPPGRLRRHDDRPPRRLRRAVATTTASLRFDGSGVRLDGLNVEKGGGAIAGAAFVGWDATYSFNVDGRRIPVESIARLRFPKAPLSGIAEFSADGSGTFDAPRNDYRFRVNDLFIGEEGVGQVTATLALRGTELSGEIDAASPRLAVTATGRIAMTPQGESELAVRFHDMSLDPYVRLFVPRLSPLRHGRGQRIDSRLGPPGRRRSSARRRHRRHARHAAVRLRAQERGADSDVARQGQVKIDELQLVGVDTRLRLGGLVDLRNERIALQANGDANLGHPAGVLPRRAGLGPRRADGRGRRPAPRAGVLRPRDDYQRPHPPLLAAQLARCDQRRALVRSARRSARRVDGDDGRRHACSSAAGSGSRATSRAN